MGGYAIVSSVVTALMSHLVKWHCEIDYQINNRVRTLITQINSKTFQGLSKTISV